MRAIATWCLHSMIIPPYIAWISPHYLSSNRLGMLVFLAFFNLSYKTKFCNVFEMINLVPRQFPELVYNRQLTKHRTLLPRIYIVLY